MAKITHELAVAFEEQAAEGTMAPDLGGLTDTWLLSDGLMLGSAGEGIADSGISLSLGSVREEKAVYAGTLTRGLDDFIRAEIPTFTFTWPFCNNRADATNTPVDGDCEMTDANFGTGIKALLLGAGLGGAAWGAGIGWDFTFGQTLPFSTLIAFWNNRIEIKDCRCSSLSISYVSGSVPKATATISGTINEHTEVAFPTTVTYGVQSSVAAAKLIDGGPAWRDTRGFDEATLDIANNLEDFGDCNDDATGRVYEVTSREVKVSGKWWADDTIDESHEYEQMTATAIATLDSMSWQVGAAMTSDNPALAHKIEVPDPLVVSYGPDPFGTRAGTVVEAIGRGDAGDDELTLRFL